MTSGLKKSDKNNESKKAPKRARFWVLDGGEQVWAKTTEFEYKVQSNDGKNELCQFYWLANKIHRLPGFLTIVYFLL